MNQDVEEEILTSTLIDDEEVSEEVSADIPQPQLDCSLNVQEVSRGDVERIPMSLPSQTDGSFKTYMDYKAITSVVSDQYKLQQQAYTDNEGFRRIGADYIIAIGQYYSQTVGDRFHIKLDSGIEFTAIVGDIKRQQHTDSTNRYVEQNGSILEFIVATKYVNDMAKVMGDMSYSNLSGGILSIERIVVE